MMIIDGKSDNDNAIDILLGVFFITLGINAMFITSYKLPLTLYSLNFGMAVIGACYITIALLDYKHWLIKYVIEVTAFTLLIINAFLATIGINDHADPISYAAFGIFLFVVKIRREWLEKTGGK